MRKVLKVVFYLLAYVVSALKAFLLLSQSGIKRRKFKGKFTKRYLKQRFSNFRERIPVVRQQKQIFYAELITKHIKILKS